MRRALVLVLALVASSCGGASMPTSAPSGLLGAPAPAFERTSLDGARVSLDALKGRPVIVKLFASYCVPCKRTLPVVEDLAKAHPEIAFIGLDEDEHESDARAMVSAFGLTFPVVHDREQVLAARFHVSVLPATFAIARDGRVVWLGNAAQSERELSAVVEALAR